MQIPQKRKLQNSTELAKTCQTCTKKQYQTRQNTNIYTTLTKLDKNLQILTQLDNTTTYTHLHILQNYTQLYNTLHNFTKKI